MLKRLIVVYNPRSSHHKDIEREVLVPVRKMQGWLLGKFGVENVGLDENAQNLAKILKDGDLVVVAGGDGTAAVATNGIMLSEKDVVMGVLGYGNFNDMARMLKTKRPVEYGGEYIGGVSEIVDKFEAGKVTEIYPLEAKVDGKHWRYAPCYLTLGLLAESTAVFDEEKVRRKLKTGKKGLVFSVWQLAKWYFRHHKQEFLAKGELRQEFDDGKKRAKMIERETVEVESSKEEITAEVGEKKDRVVREETVEGAEKKAARKETLRKERQERWQVTKERWGRRLKVMRKWLRKLGRKLRKLGRRIVRKTQALVIELSGRSKARVSDLKVQTKVKVAETRQKRQDKIERENANRPEISIDTAMTRKMPETKKIAKTAKAQGEDKKDEK